jgi:hypothetical protein
VASSVSRKYNCSAASRVWSGVMARRLRTACVRSDRSVPSRRSSRVHSADSRRQVSSPAPALPVPISAHAALTSASICGSRRRTPSFVRPGRATSARNCGSSTQARAISVRAPSCPTGVFGLATARHRRHRPACSSSQLSVTIRTYDASSRADSSSLATSRGARRTPIDTRHCRPSCARPNTRKSSTGLTARA